MFCATTNHIESIAYSRARSARALRLGARARTCVESARCANLVQGSCKRLWDHVSQWLLAKGPSGSTSSSGVIQKEKPAMSLNLSKAN